MTAPALRYVGSMGRRLSAEEKAQIEQRTLGMLLSGATYAEIRAAVGISAPTILRIREAAGLPPSVNHGGQSGRSIDEGIAADIEVYGDGHARWGGPWAGRMPQLFALGDRFNVRRVLFEQHHGRPPEGYVRSSCGDQACVAGAHSTDGRLRSTTSEEPVTVQALTDLLEEIDLEGGPEAARNNRLHLPSERTAMTTAPATPPPAPALPLAAVSQPAGRATPENVSFGQLLKWADAHDDETIRDQAGRARATLAGLRHRYDTDKELTELGSEAEQLERRLAEVRAREAELAPPKAKKSRTPLDYPAAEVRAWARDNSVACPPTGRVPKAVVDAWRAATSPAASGAQ